MPDKIIVLFIGDVIGRPGRRALKQHMSVLVRKYNPSLIIANAENAAGGIGLTEKIAEELFESVDVLTSGNHIWDKKEALDLLEKEPRLLRPANYPPQNPGHGSYVFTDDQGRKIANARFEKVVLNGMVIHEDVELPYPTGHAWRRKEKPLGPLLLQADHGPVAFRNVRIRRLEATAAQ